MPAPSLSSRRRSRRDRRARRDVSAAVPRLPWRTVRNPHPPLRILSEDQIEAIHEASLRVLREVGMKVLSRGPGRCTRAPARAPTRTARWCASTPR